MISSSPPAERPGSNQTHGRMLDNKIMIRPNSSGLMVIDLSWRLTRVPHWLRLGLHGLKTSPTGNHHMKRTAHFLTVLLLACSPLYGADVDPTRVLDPGKVPEDSRLGKLKTLNDYFPMTPFADRASWEARRKELREQVL